jgi:hypothetical protein
VLSQTATGLDAEASGMWRMQKIALDLPHAIAGEQSSMPPRPNIQPEGSARWSSAARLSDLPAKSRNEGTMHAPSLGIGKTGTGPGKKVSDYVLNRLYFDKGDRMGAACEEVLSATDRPVILEVKTDQETPPLPPHIKLEMAKKMSSPLMGEEPERWGIMEKSFLGKAVEFKDAITKK